jgi:hypothetical protein
MVHRAILPESPRAARIAPIAPLSCCAATACAYAAPAIAAVESGKTCKQRTIMKPTAPVTPATTIPVPKVESDEPVAVIPTASVAPLDGPPDGERINTFTLAPKDRERALEDAAVHALGEMRDRVLSSPLTYLAAAFTFGFVMARLTR